MFDAHVRTPTSPLPNGNALPVATLEDKKVGESGSYLQRKDRALRIRVSLVFAVPQFFPFSCFAWFIWLSMRGLRGRNLEIASNESTRDSRVQLAEKLQLFSEKVLVGASSN